MASFEKRIFAPQLIILLVQQKAQSCNNYGHILYCLADILGHSRLQGDPNFIGRHLKLFGKEHLFVAFEEVSNLIADIFSLFYAEFWTFQVSALSPPISLKLKFIPHKNYPRCEVNCTFKRTFSHEPVM